MFPPTNTCEEYCLIISNTRGFLGRHVLRHGHVVPSARINIYYHYSAGVIYNSALPGLIKGQMQSGFSEEVDT
jgi:hypothetical protein